MRVVKYYKILVLFLIVGIMPVQYFAQEIVIVPTTINGEANGAFNKFIMGDTTGTGERNDPDRIYKLERGKIYIQNALMEPDFDFKIIADADDPANPTRPPMIIPGYDDQGVLTEAWYNFTGDNKTIVFKNIILQNVGPDLNYAPSWCIQISGENVKANFDNVVFNGFQGGAFLPVANGYKLFLNDCVLRNEHAKTNPFMGQSIGSWPGFFADTISVVNTTFFNNTSYVLLPNRSIVDYIRFEHNTVFTNIIQPVFAFWMTNADFKNNIFYGTHAIGVSGEGAAGGWYSEDDQPPAIISLQKIDSAALATAELTEADRVMNVENNNYFIPQRIKDYWDNSIAANDSFVVQKPVWINARTQAMFDDDAAYPGLNIQNNYIDVDPGFDATLETAVLDLVFEFINGFNTNGWAWEGGIVGHYAPSGDIFNLQWPLPEDLTYSNADLATGGSDGLHLGDLNWYPTDKATWLTDIERDFNVSVPNSYELLQNYPNPFNPTTVINFSIPSKGMTTLKVYNIIGQEVITLVNENLEVGSYKYGFDASGLTSGVYFYKLKSNNYSEVKKMMLLK